MRIHSALLWLIAYMMLGCEGTSTGNPAVNPGPGGVVDAGTPKKDAAPPGPAPDGSTVAPKPGSPTPNPLCDEDRSDLSDLAATTPLGFTAGDVLALANGDHHAPIAWLNQVLGHSDSGYVFQPEAPAETVLVTISQRDTKPRFVKRTIKPSLGIGAPATACAASIEVDVHVQLQSSSDALEVSYDSTLTATHANVAEISTFRIARENLSGTLTFMPTQGWAAYYAADISLSFSHFGMSGAWSASVMSGDQHNPGIDSVALARWPSAAVCASSPDDLPLLLSTSLGDFTGQNVVDTVNAVTDLRLTWQGAVQTSLDIQFDPANNPICVRMDTDGLNGARFVIAGNLTLTTGDGRIDAHWSDQSLLVYSDANGDLTKIEVGIVDNAIEFAASDSFEKTFGVRGVDLSGLESAAPVLTLNIPANSQSSSTGQLELRGIVCTPADDDAGAAATANCAKGSIANTLLGSVNN